jgi:uncharacterized Tic20 family protein
MIGADSVMVVPNQDYPRIVDSFLAGKTMATISTSSCDSSWKLVQDSCQVYVLADGTSVAKFSRWINPVAPPPESRRRLSAEDQSIHLVDGGDMVLTWAYGRRMQISFHPLSTSGALVVNLATGEAFEYHRNKSIALYIHGIALFLAFFVFVPMSVAVVKCRGARVLPPGPTAHWFSRHWMITSVLTIPAIVIGTVAGFLIPSASHMASTHSFIGIGVVAASVLLVIFSLRMCRPALVDAGNGLAVKPLPLSSFSTCQRVLSTMWIVAHKVLGYGSIVAAVAACITGFGAGQTYARMLATFSAYIAYIALFAAVLVIGLLVWQCKRRGLCVRNRA